MSNRELELLGWVFELQGDLKKASKPNSGAESSTEESLDGSDGLLSSSDARGDRVASSDHLSTLADGRSALSAEAPEFVPPSDMIASDPFGYQLKHPSPQRNRFITRSTQLQPPLISALTRKPSGSSAEDDESTAAPLPTMLGYLELTDDLIRCICPFDLLWLPCPHDETFQWNWIDARWESAGGGCGMLSLCEALQSNPPPPPPAFIFPVLITHPDLTYRISGYHSRSQVTSRESKMTASSEDDRSYRLYTGRPMTSTLRAPVPRERLPPPSLLPTDHPDHALHCPHLHRIPKSCTSVTRRRPCLAVSQGWLCEHGHDLASSRAYSEKVLLPQHRQEYLEKRVRPGTVFLDRKGRWCWQRKEVIWRVGEMVDVDVGESISNYS